LRLSNYSRVWFVKSVPVTGVFAGFVACELGK
jgi:hypothetical protein